jgi:hypothetical protein
MARAASDFKEIRLMTRRTFCYGALLVGFTLAPALTGRPASADDGKSGKDKTSLSGKWGQKDAELRLEFTNEDKLTIFPHGDSVNIQVECSYKVAKDGVVKAKVTALGGPDNVIEQLKAAVPIGLEFRFKWKVDGEAATLDDFEGKDAEGLKNHLEGEYTKKS